MAKWLPAMLAAVAAASTACGDQSVPEFSRYQVILERKPFGDLPPPQMNLPQVPPPESFAKSLRLCTIIEEDETGNMRIGFIDTRSNKSYMLAAGESEDGIELVSADFDNEEAVLRQGSEMALIKLQSGEVRTISPQEQQQFMQQQQGQQGGGTRLSYAERRRMRQQQPPEPPPEPKYTGEELAKHLYEYQMEVIRQGLPPLPIPLTPEQDAQLVREGVLPPQ